MENDAIEIEKQGFFEGFFNDFRKHRDRVHDVVLISHSQVAERCMWGSRGHCAILVAVHYILRCFQHGQSLSKRWFFKVSCGFGVFVPRPRETAPSPTQQDKTSIEPSPVIDTQHAYRGDSRN